MAYSHPLRAWREAHGIKQSDLARSLNVSPVTVSRWENGERKVAVDYLERIANKTGIAPGDLRPDLRDKLKLSA